MGHQTEAACLLQTGAQYPRRLGLRPASGQGDLVFAGFKHGAFSLYFGDEPIDHFDLEGRWQRVFQNGTHYLKALDTTVVALERIREGESLVLRRRSLSNAEANSLDESIRARAVDVLDGWEEGRLQPVESLSPAQAISSSDLLQALRDVARWDGAAWSDHRTRFKSTYGPLGFLPPEAQQAVVLQATINALEGPAFGRGPGSDSRIRSQTEFDEHVGRVSTLLGKRVLQCRSVFISGSDVLRKPIDAVSGHLSTIAGVFPIDASASRMRLRDLPELKSRLSGVGIFLDEFEPPLPDLDGWRRLRELHLRRVILGIESGDPTVRALFAKHWKNETLQACVADLKAEGLEVSVVTLIGAGGRERAETHEKATSDLLNTLPLGPGDLVYLIDALEVGGDTARERMQAEGLTPLTDGERLNQQARLLSTLAPLRTDRRAKVAPYSLEKQWA